MRAYLARLTELELINRERPVVERRITARFLYLGDGNNRRFGQETMTLEVRVF